MMLAGDPGGVPVVGAKPIGLVRRFVVAAGLFIVLGALVFAAAGGSETGRIAGAGSTFVDPILQRVSNAYQGFLAADRVDVERQTGESRDWTFDASGIDYDPVGSIGGLVRLGDPRISFAATEVPFSPDELQNRGLVQFPIVMGAAAPVVNLDLRGRALTLDAATLAKIYTGAIQSWSDPAIASLNGDVTLPAGPISVRWRSDGSGTTFTFTAYLARDPVWTIGRAAQLRWPVGEGADGTGGLVAAVRATPGAIGYAEVGQARRAGLTPVRLINAAGAVVEPSAASVRAATKGIDWTSPEALSGNAPPSDDPAAWPMAATVYVVMRQGDAATATGRALGFFRFFYAEAARSADALGFVPLPAAAVSAIETYWTKAFSRQS